MCRIGALLDGQLHTQHVVGRVTSGGEHSASDGCLVDWRNVGIVLIGLLLGVGGDEPHVGHCRVKDLVVGFVEALQVLIPTRSIKEESMHVAAVLGSLTDIMVFAILGQDEEVEGKSIDGVFILNKKGGTLRA